MGKWQDGNLRIGSTDRANAVTALAEHLSEGRLDIGEYDQRCAVVANARTRNELEAVFEDLPSPHPEFGAAENAPAEPEAGASPPSRSLVEPSPPTRERTKVMIVALVLFAIVAIVGVTVITGAWWAFIPALAVVALLAMLS